MVTSSDERRYLGNLIRLVFFAVSLGTVIAFFSRVHWFAELFSHFRFYFLLVQALLVLVFLHSERRSLMVATLLLSIPNAWVVVPYLAPLAVRPSTAVADARGEEIDMVALNVNYLNEDYAAMRDYLDSVSPDVIVVAEITDEWARALKFLDAIYPHRIGERRSDPWGLMVYSRLPFVESELLDLGVADTVHARIVLRAGQHLLQIMAVHLFPPTSPRGAWNRNRQLVSLARRVSVSDLPTAVVGDMNLTPFSPYFDEFTAAAGVVDARRDAGFHFTWPTLPVPLWIPIDHALVNPAVKVRRVQRGPEVGSDHYPLEISVSCCGPGAG
ncbi:MAG: endonuclease/exonuclease/phosphatase family protein [Gammaproteobacteria bacterium]